MRQLNSDGFKDIEITGTQINIKGGHIILDGHKSVIYHDDAGIRTRLIKTLKSSLQS